MPHIVLGTSAIAASLLAATALTVLPNEGMAFDLQNATVDTGNPTVKPNDGTQLQDPDEKLTAPSNNGSLPLLTNDSSDSQSSSPGTTLQLGSGATLQIMGGTGPTLGLQSGAPMGPVIDTNNPADNRSLIPSP